MSDRVGSVGEPLRVWLSGFTHKEQHTNGAPSILLTHVICSPSLTGHVSEVCELSEKRAFELGLIMLTHFVFSRWV